MVFKSQVPRMGVDIQQYAEREFSRIEEELRLLRDGIMDIRYVLPEKPKNGLYYADGVQWNPGSGKGIYRYDEDTATFVFLGFNNQYTNLSTSGNITIDGTIDSIKHLNITDAVPVEITLANYAAGQPIIILVHNVGGAVVTFAASDFVVADNRAGAGDVITGAGSLSQINGFYDSELAKGVLS